MEWWGCIQLIALRLTVVLQLYRRCTVRQGLAKAGMAHSDCGLNVWVCTVQVKL